MTDEEKKPHWDEFEKLSTPATGEDASLYEAARKYQDFPLGSIYATKYNDNSVKPSLRVMRLMNDGIAPLSLGVHTTSSTVNTTTAQASSHPDDGGEVGTVLITKPLRLTEYRANDT